VVDSPNFIPGVAGITVDLIHTVDTVKVVLAWGEVGDDGPLIPGTIADGTDEGASVG
jgi:hypothetical protein